MREYAPVHILECTSTLPGRLGEENGLRDRCTRPSGAVDCGRGLSGRCPPLQRRYPAPRTSWSFPLRWYGTDPPPDGLALGTLARIVGLMRPFWRRVAVAFLLGVTMLAITSVIPLVTKTIIDEGLTKRVPGVLGRAIALLTVL